MLSMICSKVTLFLTTCTIGMFEGDLKASYLWGFGIQELCAVSGFDDYVGKQKMFLF